MSSTWIYGKVHPGWYMAYNSWKESYAEHWRALGYRVECSRLKPEDLEPTEEEKSGT